MGQKEVTRISDVPSYFIRSLRRIREDFQKIDSVTRTVWLYLPEVSTDVVLRLRRLYTKAIRGFIKRLQEEKLTEKEIYHEFRKHSTFSQLPARMLDRAGREAYQWVSYWNRERFLTDKLLRKWRNWASRKGIDLPEPVSGRYRIITYPQNLKGVPGNRCGQWLQTNLRIFVESESQNINVSIDRVIVKARAVIGGKPEQLLRKALEGRKGYSMGAPRLLNRERKVYLAVPVITKVKVPKIESLSNPTMIGVDLGINSLAVAVAISDEEKIFPAKVVSGKRLKHKIGELWGKRRKAAGQNNSVVIQTIDNKTRRIILHWIGTTANAIVQYAAQFDQPIITLENLSNYQPTRRRIPWAKPKLRDQLSKWARGEIGKSISRKAALRGIPVIWVNPAYSSRVCPRGCLCLLTSFQNSVFHCPACGVKLSRDINAAIELARRGKRQIKKIVKME